MRRAGIKVRGEDLQGDLPVLEQRDLPGLPVVLDLDGLLSPGDLAGTAAAGDGGDDRQARRDRQRRPPVADPVHVLFPAVPEHLRIRAAAVEPEHDRRARRRGLLQLRQRLRQGSGQPGRLPGHEAHRPPVMRGHMGVRAAPFRLAALVVPALRDRLGAGVGDEMVIDVVHAGGDRVGGQHRAGSHLLQRQRIGRVSDPGQPGPQGPQVRQHRQPGQRPRARGRQVLDLLCRRSPQREAHAGRRQQGHIGEPVPACAAPGPGRGLQHLPRPGTGRERVQQHRPRIPRPEHPAGDPRPARSRRQGRRLPICPALPCARQPGPAAGFFFFLLLLLPCACPRPGLWLRSGSRPGELKLLLPQPGICPRRWPRGQAAGHRGPRHAQPPADLQIRFPLLTPLLRQVLLILVQRPRPARAVLAAQRRSTLPRCRRLQP